MKNIRIFVWKFSIFLVVKFSVYLNRHVFVIGQILHYILLQYNQHYHHSKEKVEKLQTVKTKISLWNSCNVGTYELHRFVQLCSLIRIFTWHILDSQVCINISSHEQQRLMCGCAGWFESFLGKHQKVHLSGVLLLQGSKDFPVFLLLLIEQWFSYREPC